MSAALTEWEPSNYQPTEQQVELLDRLVRGHYSALRSAFERVQAAQGYEFEPKRLVEVTCDMLMQNGANQDFPVMPKEAVILVDSSGTFEWRTWINAPSVAPTKRDSEEIAYTSDEPRLVTVQDRSWILIEPHVVARQPQTWQEFWYLLPERDADPQRVLKLLWDENDTFLRALTSSDPTA